MKIISTLILSTLYCSCLYAQKLTLTDLTILCNKKNWEDVNQSLLAKNWEYYDSEKGNTNQYNTITWSFSKDYFSDEAKAWFYLFTYEGYPNKISYSVFNKESYSLIQNSISSSGFKLINSEIEDNEIVSTYSNTNFILEISTEKREKNDYTWENQSITAYNITLIKKAGIYDPDNGKKIDYYYDGTVEAEYNLLNGKMNGQLKVYHDNGQLKKIGNYTNGVENGQFKEYDKNGIIEAEYSMLNGELNGSFKTYFNYTGNLKKTGSYLKGKEHGNFVEYDDYENKTTEYVMANGMKNGELKIYENGKIDVSTTYKDDVRNGQCTEYYYNEETGKLQLKQIGDYLNEERNGTWKLIFVEENNSERVLTFENYISGIKNGQFQEAKGDSLIIGNYLNDKLQGEYKVYLDVNRLLLGGVIKTNIADLILIADGNYYEDEKSGYWKYFDFTGTLRSEGRFSNGQENGEWKYYYTSWGDGKDGLMPYSKQLFLTQNYLNGLLDGKSIRYSYLSEEEYPCSEIDKNTNSLDTCTRFVYQKVFETAFYKNNKRNGPFELRDSTNELIAKGNFKDDLKEGEWLQRYSDKDINEETYFIFQKGNYIKGQRDGQWVQYYTEGKIAETFNYKNGNLNGEYVIWNQFNKPREKKQFNSGKLVELITYDSLGKNPVNQYEIFDEFYNSFKCRKTTYFENGYSSQEYWLKKEKEIDHNWFELMFEIAIDKKLSDETKAYKDGAFKSYNSNNQLIVIGKYFKEDKIGLWTFYFYDQNVKIESNFIQNNQTDEKYFDLNSELFSGSFIYIENGIKEERRIKNGLRNGKTIYIDTKTKKTIKKENYKNGILK